MKIALIEYLDAVTGKSANKPVLCGFTVAALNGSAGGTACDGAALCKYGDIVVISVNHRLNILGYIDLSDYGETYANSQNAGNDDLILALTWIQKYPKLCGTRQCDHFWTIRRRGKSCFFNADAKLLDYFIKAMIMSGILAQGTMAKDVDTRPVVPKMLKDLESMEIT